MKQPVRLAKEENYSKMEVFCMKYSPIIVFFLLILLAALIIALIFAFLDVTSAGNITMVESGNYYNHLKDVI